METIILISVGSTLGVVALVTAIVVAFNKLKSKVDETQFENFSNEMSRRFEEIYTITNNTDEETRRFIDSRCDKLDTKIQDLKKNNSVDGKQLLTD